MGAEQSAAGATAAPAAPAALAIDLTEADKGILGALPILIQEDEFWQGFILGL